jgi:hypothetical protein
MWVVKLAGLVSALGQFGCAECRLVLESACVFIVIAPFFLVNGSRTR